MVGVVAHPHRLVQVHGVIVDIDEAKAQSSLGNVIVPRRRRGNKCLVDADFTAADACDGGQLR